MNDSQASAYPLAWPQGAPRWPSHRRGRAPFKQTDVSALDFVQGEVRRMGGSYLVISTNIELRRDGLPYANQKTPADPGAAIYFLRKGKQMTFACDRWDRVRDNLCAIGKTIEAIRGIERWGSTDMMERAFQAFEALPGMKEPSAFWRDILGLHGEPTRAEVDQAYRDRAKTAHPNAGGQREEWDRLVAAYEAAKSVTA